MTVETPGRPRILHRVVGTGGSFGSTTLRQEIGLGAASRIVSVEVTWPSTGKTDRLKGLELRQTYIFNEGDTKAERMDPPRFELSAGSRPSSGAD